ncbi:MAG: hypothetical protein V3R99_14200 [Thermoguttaceae bacterium]
MKGSILGLLMLVVGAAAGFGIHQYLEPDHGLWTSLMDRVAGRASDVEAVEQPSLEAIEKKIDELSQLAQRNDRASASRRASVLLDQVDRVYDALVRDPRFGETKLSKLRVSTLHAKYAGAKVNRAQLAEPFQEFANRLVAQRPDSNEAAQATLLQVLVKHDLGQPAGQDLFEDLDDYAATYSQSLSAMLYCQVAQELVQNEQDESAKTVLHRGLQTYRSTPAAGQLVRQLIDLKLSKAPAPGFTQADWNNEMQALQLAVATRAEAGSGVYARLRRT